MIAAPLPRLAAIGCGLLVLTIAALSLHVPGELGIGSDTRMAIFVLLACIACALHFVASQTVLRGPALPPLPFWGILAIAAALRVIVMLSPSFLSSDLYRYVWDGRVQAAGINPYIHIPSDPAIAFLRDTAIYPHINRADYAPTIYPPVAQMFFFAVSAVSQSTRAMKIAMTGVDALAIFLILRLLRAANLPRDRVLLYAWHPLPLWEFAGNAHVDVIAIAFILLAMLAHVHNRASATGAAIAAAVLIKFLPAVVLPALWRRWDWRFPAIFSAVIVAAYLCYSGAGWHVFGFLSGYAAEEGIDNGGGIFALFVLSRLVTLPPIAAKLYLALVALALLVLGLRMVFSRVQDPPAPVRLASRVLVLTTLLTAALSPHYPWYFCWLLPPLCLAPSAAVLALVSASFLIYLNPIHTELLWPSAVYLPFLALLLVEWRHRRSILLPPKTVMRSA